MLIFYYLFIFFFFPFVFSDGLRCNQLLSRDAFFTLEILRSSVDRSYNFTKDDDNYRLYYSFCYTTTHTCRNLTAYAILYKLNAEGVEDETSCIRMTSDSLISGYKYSLIDSEEVSSGVKLSMIDGDPYKDSADKKYETKFEIGCYKDPLNADLLIKDIDISDNELTIHAISPSGCPVLQISAIYNLIVNNKYLLGSIMIVVGLVECFFGLAILGPSLFSIGFLTGFGFLLLLFGEFIIKPTSASVLVWVLIIICVMCGCLVGYLATSLPKIGFFALGIWLGVVSALIINNLFLYKIETNPPDLLLYVLMLVLGASGAFLSKWKWKFVCIISTSFLGAYLVVRALSIFIGYYPDELTIAKKIRYKETEDVGWEFYVYFVFIMLLTFSGVYVQWINKRKGGRYNGDFGLGKEVEEVAPIDKSDLEMSLMKENSLKESKIK